MDAKSIARFGMLTALALVLGYLENLIPIAPGIPGIKLGLSNTVLLYGLYLMGIKESGLLMVLKVLLSSFLFAGVSTMLYSFAGGILSLLAMFFVKRLSGVSILGVSVAGAACHNIGQILAAGLVVGYRAAFSYLPVLLISAILTGILTGTVAKYAIRGLKAYGFGKEKK